MLMQFKGSILWKLILIIIIIAGYFGVLRPIRGWGMEYVVRPFYVSVASPNVGVYPGNSSVNTMVLLLEHIPDTAIQPSDSSMAQQNTPVRLESGSANQKFVYSFKMPGDVWLLIGLIGLVLLSASKTEVYLLLFGQLLLFILAHTTVWIGITVWIPALHIADLLIAYLIPSGTMLLLVLSYAEQKKPATVPKS